MDEIELIAETIYKACQKVEIENPSVLWEQLDAEQTSTYVTIAKNLIEGEDKIVVGIGVNIIACTLFEHFKKANKEASYVDSHWYDLPEYVQLKYKQIVLDTIGG